MYNKSRYKKISGIAVAIFIASSLYYCSNTYGEGSSRPERKYYNEMPHNAYDFYDSLGVCAHVTVYDTKYGDRQEVLRQLQYLDIRYIRDDVRGPFGKMLDTYEFFGRNGIKFDVIVGKYVPNPAKYRKELGQLAPYLVSIEGANEVDNIHMRIPFEPDARILYEKAIAHQYELYKTVKSLPETSHLPVYNFTTVMHEHSDALRELLQAKKEKFVQPIADFDNIHAYDQTGLGPDRDTNKWINQFALFETLPKVLTETGYTTITYSENNKKKGGWRGVSEKVSAKLLLNTIFSAYGQGIEKIYIYQLQDDIPDSEHLEKEAHFGLFDFQGEPKPAAVGIRNMRLILGDTSSVEPAPQTGEPLSWWVEQSNGAEDYDFDRHHLLLRKSDGTYFLVVWAEPVIWDKNKHAPLQTAPGGNHMRIGFSSSVPTVKVYDPLLGDESLKAHENVEWVDVDVIDHPVILEIDQP